MRVVLANPRTSLHALDFQWPTGGVVLQPGGKVEVDVPDMDAPALRVARAVPRPQFEEDGA